MSASFRDLVVWQKAMDLTELVYRETRSFPKEEMFGLTGQMRRAAVSIPSNIAEGQGRNTSGEFRQFLGQARGSLLELLSQTEVAQRLALLDSDAATRITSSSELVLKLLNGLIASLGKRKV